MKIFSTRPRLALINFNDDASLTLGQGCVVSPCNIQQGESKQASRAFVTPTTLSVLRATAATSRTCPLASPRPSFAIPYLFVPSHRLGYNLFRLQLSVQPFSSSSCRPYSFNLALSHK